MKKGKIEIKKPGNTPLIKIGGLFGIKNLYMKDETKNPNHTFKDRLAYEMIKPIVEAINKNKKFSKTTFSSISYGNTAFSMGFYCNKLNELYGEKIANSIAFMPFELENRRFGPNTEGRIIAAKKILDKIEKRCDIIKLDLNKKIYSEKDLEDIGKEDGKVLDKFIDISEGLDRPAYADIIKEAFEKQIKPTDYVIVPFGAGILCNEIIDYIKDNGLKTKVIPVSSGDPNTIAIMLYGIIWVDTKSLLEKGIGLTKHKRIDKKGRKREQYLVYNVKDNEILDAMKILSKNNITAEPSGASGFAILNRLNEICPEFNKDKHSVLVINTGNGLLNF